MPTPTTATVSTIDKMLASGNKKLWSGNYSNKYPYDPAMSYFYLINDTTISLVKIDDSIVNISGVYGMYRLSPFPLKYCKTDSINSMILYACGHQAGYITDRTGNIVDSYDNGYDATLSYYYAADTIAFHSSFETGDETRHTITCNLNTH